MNQALPTRLLAVVMIGLAVTPSALFAAGRKSNNFEERTSVIAVEVPVNVVDKSGHPIRGLEAKDFEVQDEGKVRLITDFEVIDLTATTTSSASGRVGGVEVPPPLRRYFLLLFDISFSNPAAVLRARTAAKDLVLQHLHPSDLVAVATYSLETGPRLVLTFTPDRAQIAHAVESLGFDRSSRVDPLRFLISTPSAAEQTADISQPVSPNLVTTEGGSLRAAAREQLAAILNQLERSEKSFQRSQVTSFARALGEMANKLRSVNGRKQVLFFSEGFDSRLLTGVPRDAESEGDLRALDIQRGNLSSIDSDDLYGNTRVQNELATMLAEFKRADCVIQSVDIGGLRADDSIGDASATGQGQRSRINSGQEGLLYMAKETGGELFANATSLRDQLPRVLERSALTYLLTFQTDELPSTGRFRRLKVKLKDGAPSDARLSYRQGYFEPRPFRDLDPLERDLLASDAIATAADADGLRLSVLAAPFRAAPQLAYVPVIVEIDGASLLDQHRDKDLPVEIYAYATNAKNEMRGFFTQQIALDVEKGRNQLASSGIKYYGHMQLGPGEYQIRVLARNGRTGHTGVKVVELSIPSFDLADAFMLPPLFPEQGARWLMVRQRDPNQNADSTVYPFTIAGQPYIPSARPLLASGDEATFYLVGYNLGDGVLDLGGQLLAPDGTGVAGGALRLVERTSTGIQGYDKLRATLQTPRLEAGFYTLQVALTNAATGTTETSSIPIEIRN
jgi:VWFA-related protein